MRCTRVAASLLCAVPAMGLSAEGPVSAPGPQCSGDYADFLSSLRPEGRAFEGSADAGYTYCIRTVATYEHLSYGRDGKIRKQYIRHVRHGTGFAYRVRDGEYYLATNEHVAEQPEVTESDTDVEGVPAGSRKVREVVRIVRNEADDYEPAQIPLAKVVADEALDVAVLKTRQPLRIMPYRVGRSSALKVGNAVQVRGYPLGAFAAANTGKVISVAQPDRERGWNHEDFAVDALLNSGNSGSPVFAISCRTGELELVGIYHAGYRDAQGLNVVVAVDQLRDLLQNLRAPRRDAASAEGVDRRRALADLRRAPRPFVMPFGEQMAVVEVEGDAVRFSILEGDNPLSSGVRLQLVERGGDPISPSALILPSRFGDREIPWSALELSVREPAKRLYDSLWRQLASVLEYRAAEARGREHPEAQPMLAQVASRLRARRSEQGDLMQSLEFESDELAWPGGTDAIAGREAGTGPQDAADTGGTAPAGPAPVSNAPTPKAPITAVSERH